MTVLWSRGQNSIDLTYDPQGVFVLTVQISGNSYVQPMGVDVGYAFLAALYNPQANTFPAVELGGVTYQLATSSKPNQNFLVVFRDGVQWGSIHFNAQDMNSIRSVIPTTVWSDRQGGRGKGKA